MKALIPLLLVSTSALAVTTVQYAHRAAVERKRADETFAVSQKNEARIRELEKKQGTLEQQLLEAQRPAMTADVAKAPALHAAPVPPPTQQAAVAQVAPLSRAYALATTGGFTWQPSSPRQQSPAAQRYMEWQRKTMMRRQYEGVGQALGISQAQADKLIDTLTNRQTQLMSQAQQPLTFDPNNPNARRQAALDYQQRREADVAAVIGQDKIPQWQEFEKTMPERFRVSAVGEQMQQMGVPLTDDQRQQLTDIMIEHTRENPRPAFQNGQSPEETMQVSMKWEDESEKALLERAKSVLTKDQYERYRDYQAWQSEMRANSMRMFQARAASGQVSPGVALGSVQSQSLLVPVAPPESAASSSK